MRSGGHPERQSSHPTSGIMGVLSGFSSFFRENRRVAVIVAAVVALLLIVLIVFIVTSCANRPSQEGDGTIPVTTIGTDGSQAGVAAQSVPLNESIDLTALPANSTVSFLVNPEATTEPWIEVTVDGQIIGHPRARAIGRNGLGYRTDWAEAVGITEAPKTVEDVYDMLYKFTYDDPDGNGANDTYGLEMCKYTGPWDIIQTWFGCGNGWVEQDGKLVPVHQTAEYKEALDWMRKIYADGLVRPDWATVDTANFQVDTQKGVTGVFVDTMDGSKRIWKYFEDNAVADVNDASKIATMTSVGPINGHTLATTGYNGFYLITKSGAKTEEDVKACLHFLDKMCDPEMMALADYGLKDICYDINADGKIVPNGKYDTTNCPHAGLNQAVPYVPYLTEQNPDYQLEKADYQLAYEESIANNVQYAVFNPALGYLTQSDTYAECGNDLVQILDDARTQYICGQIDEAGLQAAFDQWNARGGTQVIEEVNALYAADKA